MMSKVPDTGLAYSNAASAITWRALPPVSTPNELWTLTGEGGLRPAAGHRAIAAD